jgi:hypothetical protein
MRHTSAAPIQSSLFMQILGFCGVMFHMPSLFLTIWFFPPLAPVVQIFIMSGFVYLRLKFIEGFNESELRKAAN